MTDQDGNGRVDGGRFDPPEGYILLGRLGKTFGLAGSLYFRALGTAEADALFELDGVFLAGFGPASIREVRQQGKGVVVSFETIRNPERAQELVNSEVYAPSDALPVASDGAQYLEALRGRPVLIDARPFGTVSEVGGVAGAELLSVERPEGGVVLLPLRAPYIVLTETAVLVEDPPKGLVDPDGLE